MAHGRGGPSQDSTGAALGTVSHGPLRQSHKPSALLGREERPGASPPFPRGETKAREVGSDSFSGETLLSYAPASLFTLLSLPWIFFFLIWGMGIRQLKTDLFLTWLPSSDVVFISLACPLPAHATLCPSAKGAQPSTAPPHHHHQRPTQQSCKRPQVSSCSLLLCRHDAVKQTCRDMDIRGSPRLDGGGPWRAGGSF